MKERVREAIFNLVGPSVKGTLAIDLFAGTGALGIEAISRGASHAILVERHFPTVELIRQASRELEIETQLEIISSDTFFWVKRELLTPGEQAWLVFCSPPYDLFVNETDKLLGIVERITEVAPTGSLLVVESDRRFDTGRLPMAERWTCRSYPPAEVALWRKQDVR